MKKIMVSMSVMLLLIFFSAPAFCADGSPYISANVGLAMPNDSDLTATGGSGTTGTIEFDTGTAYAVAVGYAYENSVRIEGEFVYQANDYDKLSVTGVGSATIEGDAKSKTFLLNGYYDFNKEGKVQPFIGAGIGLSEVEAGDISLPGYGTLLSSDNDTAFAYQVSAGVGFSVSEKTSLELKYRYFQTEDLNFEVLDAEYSSHNLFAGVRLSF